MYKLSSIWTSIRLSILTYHATNFPKNVHALRRISLPDLAEHIWIHPSSLILSWRGTKNRFPKWVWWKTISRICNGAWTSIVTLLYILINFNTLSNQTYLLPKSIILFAQNYYLDVMLADLKWHWFKVAHLNISVLRLLRTALILSVTVWSNSGVSVQRINGYQRATRGKALRNFIFVGFSKSAHWDRQKSFACLLVPRVPNQKLNLYKLRNERKIRLA